ncbi:MAG: hypothetical protein FJ119_09085 [Deltaproteobacteria bacterium]|nr:hypothetical protein [Deltaproteobacteria bacterium]
MFSADTPKIISRLYDIIAALESGLAGRFTLRLHQCPGERALLFTQTDGTPFFYCGAWYELWSRSNFPLWYGVNAQWNAETVQRFLERHPEAVAFEGYRLCRAECAPVFEDGPVDPVIELIQSELAFLTQA